MRTRMRRNRTGYYVRRVIPHQWLKRLLYGALLLIAAWKGYSDGYAVGILLVFATALVRIIDILVTDRFQRRRALGWENYYDG